MSASGFLLVHRSKGICMGTNKSGRITWSVIDPSYRRAMPCAETIEQVHALMEGLTPEQQADYYVCEIQPDLRTHDGPFASPTLIAQVGLGGLLNNLLSLDFVWAQGADARSERREILRAIYAWVKAIPAPTKQGRTDWRMLLFVRRMLRKGAMVLEMAPEGLQIRLAPRLSLMSTEPAGHA